MVTLLDVNKLPCILTSFCNVEIPSTFNWLHNVVLLLTYKFELIYVFPCK